MTFTRLLLLPAITGLGLVLGLALMLDRPRHIKTVDTFWRAYPLSESETTAERYRCSEGDDFAAEWDSWCSSWRGA